MTKSKVTSIAPLKGTRILVTRAEKQACNLSSMLRDRGADVIEVPVIEIKPPESYEPLDNALQNALEYDWLILTSVNGVEAFFSRLDALGLSVDHVQHFKIAAIGPATEAAISDRGLIVDVVPPKYVAEEVVVALRRQVKGQRVLLVRAAAARDVIPTELTAAGAQVEIVDAYHTITPADSKPKLLALFSEKSVPPDLITFTSSSTVKNFLGMIVGTDIPAKLSRVHFASIGPVTSNTLREFGLPVHCEAEDFTMTGLVQAITALRNGRDNADGG